MTSPMSEIFTSFQDYLNSEQELREVSEFIGWLHCIHLL
jgi:hypothetical protein